MKSVCRLTDTAVDMICSFIHYLLLGPGNLFPPSYHLVKAVLDVPSSISFIEHVCDSCWMLYPQLQPEQYQAHRAECCVHCDNPRFEVGVGGKPMAKRSVYYFDEEQTLIDLLAKPGVLDDILETRGEAWDQPWTYWGSPAGRDADRRSNYKFSNPAEGDCAVLVSFGMFLKTSTTLK